VGNFTEALTKTSNSQRVFREPPVLQGGNLPGEIHFRAARERLDLERDRVVPDIKPGPLAHEVVQRELDGKERWHHAQALASFRMRCLFLFQNRRQQREERQHD